MSELVSEGAVASATVAAHGRGDRKEYYKKWDKFADQMDRVLTEEEKEAQRQADEIKSKDPLSEAQKKDLEKREALKEAKRQWDGVQAGEEAMKAVIADESGIEDRVILAEDMGNRQVLVLKSNTNCNYDIPSDTKLIKFFIENCKDCTVRLHCSLKTSFVEINHCERVNLIVSTHPAHTVQVDISSDISVFYHQNTFSADSKLYHASVRRLTVQYDAAGTGHDIQVQELDDFELAALNPQIAAKDQQFVTALLGESQVLVTDLVVRDARGHPTTQRELDDRRRQLEESVTKRGLDLNDEVVQKALHEYDAVGPQQRGRQYKEEGNAAFKALDYGQAAVHYTQAITNFESIVGEKDEESIEVICACYSNRAACSLKLGDHETALKDAEAALALNPEHVKAVFRKGMALHAMKRYREACPVLGKALRLNPNDKAISAALTFAERRAATPDGSL